MATVRIYKVAELLGTTSQEVLSLLKRDHGIELKSASSTVEEVVARSFVERVARQRNISLPGGDMFAEHPVPAKGGGKKALVAKKAEPAKPAAPVLGPPRLVKVVKPSVLVWPPPRQSSRMSRRLSPSLSLPNRSTKLPRPPRSRNPWRRCWRRRRHQSRNRLKLFFHRPSKRPLLPLRNWRTRPPSWQLRPPRRPHRAGSFRRRFACASRNRAESPQPARPLTPAKRPQVSQPRIVQAPAAGQAPAGTRPTPPGAAARPGTPRPGAGGARPGGYPPPPRPTTPGMLGGPRPLPSQPIGTQPGLPPRPGMPGAPGVRPPFGQRPPMGQHRPGQRPLQTRRERPSAPSIPAPAAPPPITRTITLAEGMTVKDLADKLDVRVKDVIQKLFMKRQMVTINSTLDVETAKDVAREFGAEIEMRSFEQELVSARAKSPAPRTCRRARRS